MHAKGFDVSCVFFGRNCHYRCFTYYRLVTKIQKLEGTPKLLEAIIDFLLASGDIDSTDPVPSNTAALCTTLY